MARTDQKIEVDGRQYNVTKYGAVKGTKLFVRLTKLCGEAVLKAIVIYFASDDKSGKKKSLSSLGKLDTEKNEKLVGEIIGAVSTGLLDRFEEVQTVETIKEILSLTYEFGTSNSCGDELFDDRFRGELFHMFKLVGKTLSAQYSDFFRSTASI